jgi:ribonuclease R
MLAANVAAARHFERKKMPALYRIHETPKKEKLADLREFLAELGLNCRAVKSPRRRTMRRCSSTCRAAPDAHLIQTVLLRSMQQAMYSSDNVGHFGLAYDAYTHFTSPIRRYPDLIVHRIIKHMLAGGTAADLEYSKPGLQQIADVCSGTERRADEATRDAESWLKCEYMRDKLGEELDGTITSVQGFGLFVELDQIYVDGLVHITALDNDYYHFDPVGHRLTGQRTGQVYRLGDRLRVRVAAVNLDDRKIDFVRVRPGSRSVRSSATSWSGPPRGPIIRAHWPGCGSPRPAPSRTWIRCWSASRVRPFCSCSTRSRTLTIWAHVCAPRMRQVFTP